MTRDEQVALVARIASELWARDVLARDSAIAIRHAEELVEAAEQAVDAKRGTERDWERLEAAAWRLIEWRKSDLRVGEGKKRLDGLEQALAALQPKERSS